LDGFRKDAGFVCFLFSPRLFYDGCFMVDFVFSKVRDSLEKSSQKYFEMKKRFQPMQSDLKITYIIFYLHRNIQFGLLKSL
jgi:hypothetical protein